MSGLRRQTKQRDVIRVALEARDDFVSAGDLHLSLREQGHSIGLATVYRALRDLVAEGVADEMVRGQEAVFRACQPEHHHHLVCRSCGATTEIHADEIEAWARRVAAAHGYRDPQHVVDVFGVCASCQRDSTRN